jgi:hypothetical protein
LSECTLTGPLCCWKAWKMDPFQILVGSYYIVLCLKIKSGIVHQDILTGGALKGFCVLKVRFIFLHMMIYIILHIHVCLLYIFFQACSKLSTVNHTPFCFCVCYSTQLVSWKAWGWYAYFLFCISQAFERTFIYAFLVHKFCCA